MKESQLNTLLKNNFTKYGFGHKLPDPSKENIIGRKQGKTIFNFRPNPFDGFGITSKFCIFYETKLLNGYQAFSLNRIAAHQYENIGKIYNIVKEYNSNSSSSLDSYKVLSLFIIGVYERNKGVDLFFISFRKIEELLKKLDKKSILKKELLEYKESGKSLKVVNKLFDVGRIPEVLIIE